MSKPCYNILLIFLFIQIQVSSFGQGTWERIESPIQQNLNSVCFTDSLTGWAAGDSGIIIHTTDGGDNWIIQDSKTENDIVKVFFLNSNLGWASSFNYTTTPYGTIILKTTNGGVDWVAEPYPDENIFINSVLFLDSLNGWMGGSPHALVNTTDGGINWHQANIDTSTLAFFPILSIQFYNEQYGYACGGIFDIAGVTWRTNDGGANWYAIDVADAPADEVHELYIFDSLHVMGAGGDPDFGYGVGIIRTLDGGYNWDYDEIGIQGNAFDIDFVNDAEVWAPLGPQRKFIYSVDTGSTWVDVPTPDSTAIFDVIFTDSLHGFAVGYNGAILRFTAAIPVGNESKQTFPTGAILNQNFPNPFKGSTTIKFEIPADLQHNMPAQIKVFNMFGIEVAIFNLEKSVFGTNHVTFDGANFSGGIYYYQLTIGKSVMASKRMILVK